MELYTIDPIIRFFWEGNNQPGWLEPERQIYDCLLVYVSNGSFHLRLEEREHLLQAGSVALLPPALPHESWTSPDETTTRHCIHFDWNRTHQDLVSPLQAFTGELFDTAKVHSPPAETLAHLPLVSHKRHHEPIRPILQLLLEKLRAHDTTAEHLLWPVLRVLISDPDESTSPSAHGKAERVALVLKNYIDAHFSEELGYADFCALTKLSRSHLCQLFHRVLGKPPTRYLNQVRVQHACRLLRDITLNVSQVAHAVGIPDANYFARLFRRETGLTPSAYQKTHIVENDLT